MVTKIHKNIFKSAWNAATSDHYSMVAVVSCFGGQKLKQDIAYRVCPRKFAAGLNIRLGIVQAAILPK